MKTYTIVYADLSGDVHTYTCPAADENAAAMVAAEAVGDEFVDLLHTIDHVVPKLTVVLNGDVVEAAYSDASVELIHVYSDKETVSRALENGEPLMPANRHAVNYPGKAEWAYGYSLVDVTHLPDVVVYDHKYAYDELLQEEFTSAVREELET